MLKRVSLLLLLLFIFLINIYPQNTVELLFRILKFEKSLITRTKGKINIAVVYNNNLKSSAREALKISTQINKINDKKIRNYKVSHEIILIDKNIGDKIKDACVVYVCKGIDEEKILDVAKKNKILTVASDKSYFQNVGIVIRNNDEKNKYYINVQILKDEGVNIAKELLSISKIYK